MADWSSLVDVGTPVLRIVVRLGVAVLLGALLGWDREKQAKPAGFRTHMMVTLGSASFVLLAFELGDEFAHREQTEVDPTRVLQGVVGGIGFLGAGSIIQSKGHVEGVTTAASVWVCGAVGAAAGLGAYALSVVSALLAFTILRIGAKIDARINPEREVTHKRTDQDAANTKPENPSTGAAAENAARGE